MTIEKWHDILGNIKDNFEVEEDGKDHVDEEGGIDIEYIVFSSPLGRVRLEFVSQPVVLDRKMKYSNRIGSETNVQYVYSETEKTNKLIAYKWDEGVSEWAEIDAGAFS